MLFVVVGHGLVVDHRHGQRRADHSADLQPRSSHHGFHRTAHLDACGDSGGAPLPAQRHETRVGLRLAFAHGGRNLRHDPQRSDLVNSSTMAENSMPWTRSSVSS